MILSGGVTKPSRHPRGRLAEPPMGVLCDAFVTGRVMEVSCKALQYPYHADESAEGTDIMILITGQVIMTPEHRERMIALGAEPRARSRDRKSTRLNSSHKIATTMPS